jgi:hypothetical protein
MVARNRVILAGTIALAALLVGITFPALIPAIAATNSHSVIISPSPQSTGSLAPNGTVNILVNGSAITSGTLTLVCPVQVTPPLQNQTYHMMVNYTILGPCYPANS